jgi:murein endopeptidase
MRAAAATIAVLGVLAAAVVATGLAQPARQAPPPGPPPTDTTSPAPPPEATTPPAPTPPGAPPAQSVPPERSPVAAAPTGPSRAIGLPWHGRLVNGVQLEEVSADWLTWDPVLKQIPDRPERRWGTAKLLRTLRAVLADYHRAHPTALQVLIGDLSRPHGGVFDKRFGGLGHASHQNGLDVDVYYPRNDGRLLAPIRPDQIERTLAQDLLDRFVAAGVQYVFIGTRTGLHGPRRRVQVIPHHNDHMHVRIFPPRGAG